MAGLEIWGAMKGTCAQSQGCSWSLKPNRSGGPSGSESQHEGVSKDSMCVSGKVGAPELSLFMATPLIPVLYHCCVEILIGIVLN